MNTTPDPEAGRLGDRAFSFYMKEPFAGYGDGTDLAIRDTGRARRLYMSARSSPLQPPLDRLAHDVVAGALTADRIDPLDQ